MKPLVICTTVLIETSPQAMPLGAACIATAIKNSSNTRDHFCVKLEAFSRENDITAPLLTEQLLSGDMPVCVCFSVYMWNRKILEQVAGLLKKKNPRLICIAGGPEVTADPFTFTFFDYLIAGEGESAVPALLAGLFSETSVSLPAGVYVRGEARRPVIHALSCPPETLVSPWLDGVIDPAVYGGALWELARGCPFRCSYCYESKGERKVSYFPLDRLEKELALFARKKIPQVFVLDPTYNADRKRALHMINLIKQKAPGMFFYFECRAEFIDRELARAFASIPCSLQIGLQSAHESVLELVHRPFDKKKFIRNVGFLNDAGTVFGFDLIYGLPGDSLSGFRDSIDFAINLYPNNLELFCLSVLPGTDLADRAASLGLVWQQHPPYTVDYTATFSSENMNKAAALAHACDLFYNQGRAVPWFISVLRPLHIKPSVFFSDLVAWLASKNEFRSQKKGSCLSHLEIEKLQLAFIHEKYAAKKQEQLLPAVEDCIRLQGALSRTQADGSNESVSLQYSPEDLLSPYAVDIIFFVKNMQRHRCTVHTFMTKKGVEWNFA